MKQRGRRRRGAETRDCRMQNDGNAKRRSCEGKSLPLPPPGERAARVPFNPFFVSSLLSRSLPPPAALARGDEAASLRDYILEIVNRMPADDAPADIPYISGDPFFVRISKMREEWKDADRDDLKTPRKERSRETRSRQEPAYSRKKGANEILEERLTRREGFALGI